jgi:hypothetical protein
MLFPANNFISGRLYHSFAWVPDGISEVEGDIQKDRRQLSIAEARPQTPSGFAEIVSDDFAIFHALQ